MDQEIEDCITRGQHLLEAVVAQGKSVRIMFIEAHARKKYEEIRDEFCTWDEYNEQLLRSRFSTGKIADDYRLVVYSPRPSKGSPQELAGLERQVRDQLRKLGSIRQRLNLYKSVEISATQGDSVHPHIGDKIFIVHGHDGDTKLQVAEFIERITGERPMILHEQADGGSRTIIEKFEEHASAARFAIILLTADDEGKAKGATRLNPRARQNVVLEFGYFMAKLGRGRVVALHEAGVELPSDVSGVLYKSLAGNWHTELARELKAADIEIDFSKLV